MSDEQQPSTATPKRSLMSLVEDVRASLEPDEDGVIDEEVLFELRCSLEDKVAAYGVVYRELQASCSANEQLAAVYKKRASALDASAEKLRARLLEAFDALKIRNVKTDTCTAYVKTSYAVEITNESKLPRHLYHPPSLPGVDKHAVREALKKGPVEGAHLAKSEVVVFK